jgi:predicted DsbA family dithiol-disulfide isomerase
MQKSTQMSQNDAPILIDYYSDVLCVWAWIAQPRLEELHRQWAGRVTVRHRYLDVFGDAHRKILRQWGESDGFEKFGAHVVKSADPFEGLKVNPDTWKKVRPRSSLQAHLFIKAVALVTDDTLVEPVALRIRQAFFVEARDINDYSTLIECAEAEKIDEQLLKSALRDGSAIAALSDDQRSANALGMRGSPTWVLNEGRQLLYGNVGYRILDANIKELTRHPGLEASWC